MKMIATLLVLTLSICNGLWISLQGWGLEAKSWPVIIAGQIFALILLLAMGVIQALDKD